MKIEFDLLESNYGKNINTSKFKYGKIAMIVIPIFVVLFVDIYIVHLNLLTVGIIYLGLSYLLSKLLQKSDKDVLEEISSHTIGTIKLEEDSIEISLLENERKPNVKDINEININSYYGEVTGFGRHQEVHYGTDTTIKLNIHDESKLLYVFIRDNDDRDKFQFISSYCLKMNNGFKEYTKNVRTYNGKQLNYKEIQELKKDYQ